jgi:hypothetical protein
VRSLRDIESKPGDFRTMARVVAGYVIATVVMTLPLMNWEALGTATYSGDARLMAWTVAWNSHAWLNGLRVLDANIYYPASAALTYTDPMIGVALFGLPIYALTRNAAITHNVLFIMAFLLNATAMYLLAVRVTRDATAAFVAGLIYAFSFYMMLHGHGHLSLIWVWLLPLSFVMLERWVEHPTMWRAAAWGVLVVLQILASWYLAVITVVATAVVVGWYHVALVRDRWWTRGAQVTLVAGAGAAIVWPFAAPYRYSLGTPALSEVRGFSADWASYLVPPLNTATGRWWATYIDSDLRGIWGELTMFVGYLAMAMAIAGVAFVVVRGEWRRRGVYILLAVAGLALSFGPSPERTPLPGAFDLLSALPGMEGFRVPARFGLLVLLAVAVLAACAVAAIRRRIGRPADIALVLVVPLMLAEWFVVDFPAGRPRTIPVPRIYSHPAIQSARAIVSLPDYRNGERWYEGADYLLFSTTHWRPIVNGYGRAQPPDHAGVMSHMRAFPGPNNARTMRRLGVDLVVFHADRFGAGADDVVAEAMALGEYDLVAQDGQDYLFRVKTDREAAR